MIKKSMGKSQGAERPRETLQPSSQSEPAAAGPSLTPFEIEAGKKRSESPGDQKLGDHSGTISQVGKIPVNPRVAGQLLNLPFKCLHIAYPVAQPLSEEELEAMAEPFSDFLIENGLESIARSSIVLGFHVFIAGYSRVKAIADWKKEQKGKEQKSAAAAKTDPGHGEARPGQDDARPPADR